MRAPAAFAKAFASAFEADLANSPETLQALASGQLNRFGLSQTVLADLYRDLPGNSGGPGRFPALRALARTERMIEGGGVERGGGLGQWDFLAGLVSSAAKIYTTKVQTDAAKRIELGRLNAQAAALDLQAKADRLAYADQATGGGAVAQVAQAVRAVPGWGWALGAAAAGGLGFLFLRRRRR